MKTLHIPEQDIRALSLALRFALRTAESDAALWFDDSMSRPGPAKCMAEALECMRVAYETRIQLQQR